MTVAATADESVDLVVGDAIVKAVGVWAGVASRHDPFLRPRGSVTCTYGLGDVEDSRCHLIHSNMKTITTSSASVQPSDPAISASLKA